MTTTSTLSRRTLVASAAALPALAVSAVAGAAAAVPADGIDRAGMVARAEQIVDLLSNCYIREGWHELFDRQRAAEFIESVRRFDENNGECKHFTTWLRWMSDHGQSLDWLTTGDVGSFITGAAAVSADETADAKLIALGERLKVVSATTAKLKAQTHPLYEDVWKRSGFAKKKPGVRSQECERKFKEIAKANGYSAASERWNAAAEAEHKIARAILKLPSHGRVGEGVRAAAALTLSDDMENGHEAAEMLWAMAARAGFTPPPAVAKRLKRKGVLELRAA